MNNLEPFPQPIPKKETFAKPVTLEEFLARPLHSIEHEVDAEEKEKLQILFEKTKLEFYEQVLFAINQGQLKIPAERVKDRISKIILAPYDSKKNNLVGEAGFNLHGFRLSLNTQMLSLPEFDQKHFIFHELTHALISGFSISKFKISTFDVYEVNKNGILSNGPIDPREPDRNRELKNDDINEAVTEMITLLLLNKSDLRNWELSTDGSYLLDVDAQLGLPAYPFERSKLARMVFKQNIPWTDFLDAYTEEDSEKIYGHRLDALLKKISNPA